MERISKPRAYSGMDETDFIVLDSELTSLFSSDQRQGKKMNHEFWLGPDNQMLMKVYWDGTLVSEIAFTYKGERSEEGKKVVGRPSLGTTKKVSLTLPDEIWDMIEKRKKDLGASQSQTLRMMIEEHFYHSDEDR